MLLIYIFTLYCQVIIQKFLSLVGREGIVCLTPIALQMWPWINYVFYIIVLKYLNILKCTYVGWCKSPAWNILDETIRKHLVVHWHWKVYLTVGRWETVMWILNQNLIYRTHTHTHTHTNKTKYSSLKLVSVAVTDAFYNSSGM